MPRCCRAALLALLVALAAPAAAQAAPDSVVGFDDLAAGTVVSDQYDTPGVHVQFGHPNRFLDNHGYELHCGSSTGSPVGIVDGGINGRSAEIGCQRNEIGTSYLAAIHTSIERRDVSFDLRGDRIIGNEVDLKVWGVGDVLLSSQKLTLVDHAVVPVHVVRPSADIVTITLAATGQPFGDLVVDDLRMKLDDVPPPPKFEMGLGRPSVEVVEGSTATAPVNLLRYNGSSGAVTFSLGALPPQIVGAQVTPNPSTGTTGPELRVSVASPFTGEAQLGITASGGASAGTFVGGGKVQTVRGLTALDLAQGVAVVGAQETVVPGCGTMTGEIPVGVRGGFTGPVDLAISRLDGPVVLDDTSVRMTAAGDGSLRFAYRFHQPAGVTGPSTLRLRFRPTGATEVSRDVRIFEESVRITGIRGAFHPSIVWADEVTEGSRFGRARQDRVTVQGEFPAGCTPTFQDAFGRALGIAARRDAVTAGQTDEIDLNLAAPPVSTDVRALGPGGAELARSGRIEVLGYRNDPALQVTNSGVNAGTPSYSWGDFQRTFGNDDAEQCSPFECHRDPFALIYFDNIRDMLRTNPGLCFGYATQSLLFEDDLDEPQAYTPGIFRGWQLPFAEGLPIKSSVLRWQISQRDADWQDYRQELRDDVPSLAQFRERLRTALQQKDEVTIAISQGSSGHAVVAYDMADTGAGGIVISTYNPNFPYAFGEETAAATQQTALTNSQITITPAGVWTGGIFTGGAWWTGGMDTIEIYDRMPPSDADSPFGAWLQDLVAPAETANVTSVRTGGTEALRPDGTAIRGTGVTDHIRLTGGDRDVGYELARGRSYDFTIAGAGQGTYDSGLLGSTAGAQVSGLRTAAGQQDHLVLRPGAAEAALRSGAGSPATFELLDRAGARATRMATVQLSTRRGGGDEVALTGGGVDVRHRGAATSVVATLGSVGDGAPGTVTTRAIRLGAGQRLQLAPTTWTDLGAGLRLTVRDRAGRVLRRGRAPLRATRAVGLRGVKAKVTRRGRRVGVTVTGRVTKAGQAPLLVAAVRVVRGRRVLQRTGGALRGAEVRAGRFTIPVRLRRLPRGARAQVVVSLADEAAGFASARRTTTAR